MKILISEDDDKKFKEISDVISENYPEFFISRAETFQNFDQKLNDKYDLLVIDLLMPIREGGAETNLVTQYISAIKNLKNINCSTPCVAITSYSDIADTDYVNLNSKEITVIKRNDKNWQEIFLQKIHHAIEHKGYDFIIICALEAESEAFRKTTYRDKIRRTTIIKDNFIINEFLLNDKTFGAIITPNTMGLVHTAIASTYAIAKFKPKIILMSGICAGISGKTNIYDLVIANPCHQHDAGKQTPDGFEPEVRAIHVPNTLLAKITKFKKEIQIEELISNLNLDNFSKKSPPSILIAPSSSGSSVIADKEYTQRIISQQRKLASFEMEIYSLYASAYIFDNVDFFAMKSVVDNGDENKSDDYQENAAIISAEVCTNFIEYYFKES